MRGILRPVVAFGIAAMLLGVSASAFRQPPALGSIDGRVTDAQGGLLPGVTVAVTCQASGFNARAIADSAGRFRFDKLPPGSCEVKASLAGFKAKAVTATLVAGRTESLTIVMEVGSLSEAVAVSVTAPTVRGVGGVAAAAGGALGGGGYHPGYPRPPYQPWRWPAGPTSTTSFDKIEEPPFLVVSANPLSTFSADVDTASYAYARRSLTRGALPPKDAVRIEEFLNYFRYDYPNPSGQEPFAVVTEVGACPWNTRHQLLHIGLQARRIAAAEAAPRNLVFLLDVSGSMEPADKLPLVKSAMSLLANRLTARDRVAIVTYAGNAGVALAPTRGDEHGRILDAIGLLRAGGSTNGAGGIEMAYRLASDHFDREGVNRVILASDGDFNVGVTSRGDLLTLIEAKRKTGIFLSVLGVGDDNLKDGTMEQLADRGNGNYAYLDTLEEAQKVLVREANATFIPVAKDVKIQVEFNPSRVAAYRLIGYENRAMQAEDFADDKKDAGEIGAGQSVTAVYELVPRGEEASVPSVPPLRYQDDRGRTAAAASGEIGFVRLRYKRPESDASVPMDVVVSAGARREPSSNFGFSAAVAAFGLLLRDSEFKGQASWQMAADLATRYRGTDPDGYRAQFTQLVELAGGLSGISSPRRR